ncbi:MAG: MBL fold metallo-hydrolase [Thermosynechococcaceae cyanobacterium]
MPKGINLLIAMKIRTWILCFAVALLACLGLWSGNIRPGTAAEPLTLPTAGLKLEQLAENVYGLVASTDFPPKNMATTAICNAGIVIGPKSVLAIDPFQNPALGNLLLDTVKTLTDKPIAYVVNTHYHFDHTGGNPAIASKRIPLLGRGPIREFMLTRNQKQDPNPTPPALVVNSATDLWLDDLKVHLETLEGHSNGTDLIAYVPKAKVLFTGDLLFNRRIPYVADGNIRQWQTSLDYLLKTYGDAKILPGHGPIADRPALARQHQFFADLEQLALSWKAKGLTQPQAIAASLKVPDVYKDYKFQALYQSNLETAYQQITQAKT